MPPSPGSSWSSSHDVVLTEFRVEGQATIIQDDDGAHYLANHESLQSEQESVSATDTLKVKLAAGGRWQFLIES